LRKLILVWYKAQKELRSSAFLRLQLQATQALAAIGSILFSFFTLQATFSMVVVFLIQ
jgi:hypothetical protein